LKILYKRSPILKNPRSIRICTTIFYSSSTTLIFSSLSRRSGTRLYRIRSLLSFLISLILYWTGSSDSSNFFSFLYKIVNSLIKNKTDLLVTLYLFLLGVLNLYTKNLIITKFNLFYQPEQSILSKFPINCLLGLRFLSLQKMVGHCIATARYKNKRQKKRQIELSEL